MSAVAWLMVHFDGVGESPLTILVLAVVAATWYGGLGPGALATVLSVLVADFALIAPRYELWVESTGDGLRLVILALVALAVGTMYEGARWMQRQSQSLSEQLDTTLQHVRASEADLRMLAEAMPAMVARFDAAGAVTHLNESLRAYTGLTLEDMRKRGWAAIAHPDYVAAVASCFDEARRTGKPAQIDFPARSASGEYRWHLGIIKPVRPDGHITSWIAAAVDIEERRQVEEALRKANAAKDDFLARVSHELKTPITTISGNAEVLVRRAEEIAREQREEALRDISDNASRLHDLIENLLILARVERGSHVEVEPIQVERVLESLLEDHRRRHPSRAVAMAVGAGVLPAEGYRLYVEQTVRNLLANAEKYSPLDEPIDVSVGCDGAEVTVRVLDRGGGVQEAEREAIFDEFYRSDAVRHIAGAGIGLSVASRLIDAQSGRIWYAPREGGGSEFGFALRAADELADAS